MTDKEKLLKEIEDITGDNDWGYDGEDEIPYFSPSLFMIGLEYILENYEIKRKDDTNTERKDASI